MALRRLRGLGVRRVARDERLSVVEHLDELRRRLILCVIVLAAAFAAMYAIHPVLLDVLQRPLPERYRDTGLITLSPTEPFFTVLKVAFWASILLALPVWLYQLYAYVIPAVQDQPRRRMLLVVAGASSLFVGGAAFGYFVVLPVALEFLLGFGGDSFLTQVRAGEYYGFVTMLLLGAGLMFEVPVAMLALARIGVASADFYKHQWRVAVVVIAVVAAILPGGDPFSMMLLMLPQLVLYAVGIWLAARFGGPPLWAREAWAEVDEEAPTGAGGSAA